MKKHFYWDEVKHYLSIIHGYSSAEADEIVDRFEGEWVTQANNLSKSLPLIRSN